MAAIILILLTAFASTISLSFWQVFFQKMKKTIEEQFNAKVEEIIDHFRKQHPPGFGVHAIDNHLLWIIVAHALVEGGKLTLEQLEYLNQSNKCQVR